MAVIGTVRVVGGGSKTLSAAGGGRIMWRPGSPATFSNAGTTIRVGLQDVSASGIEDGTFDVYADYVGGTDTIAANTFYRKAMTSGTKTVADGDIVAIVIEAVSVGGADSVIVSAMVSTYANGTLSLPYRTLDSGSGPAKSSTSGYGIASIEFDDGTVGFIEAAILLPAVNATSVVTFGSSSSPDEYAACFKVPFKCTVNGVYIGIGAVASADAFDVVVYSDPFGTPSVIETVTRDPNYTGSSVTAPIHVPITPITLSPDTWYAVSALPTTTNTINFQYSNFGSGLDHYKTALPFGADIKLSGRTNQTGAFTEVETYYLPVFGLRITHLDDGKYVYAQGQIGMN